MSDLKKKLKLLDKNKIKSSWESINSGEGLTTREKLEKLVNVSLKKDKIIKKKKTERFDTDLPEYSILDFSYPLEDVYGKVKLEEWKEVSENVLPTIFSDPGMKGIDPLKLLYFDTETTGLSGGTGTIPFMLGFGFFKEDLFKVKIFILNDPDKEGEFLEVVDHFLNGNNFSGTVTYNGKTFDFPLMETRYILNRKKFPLLKLPHLDFLFPARTIWKNTFESRRLGFLGDILLGISRDDDVDGSLIPYLYFDYIRSGNFALIEKVVEHNALDIVGLSALLLLGCRYVDDPSFTEDEGEIFGVASLFERSGDFEEAEKLYGYFDGMNDRDDLVAKSVKRMALLKKKNKLFGDARDLWEKLSEFGDHIAIKELSIHYEHKEKNFYSAIEFVRKGMELINITDNQRKDLEKRFERLKKKISRIEKED
ncbi:MAG: ribonuclease H-like domain-containing protein [Acidobacteriota bacterium]